MHGGRRCRLQRILVVVLVLVVVLAPVVIVVRIADRDHIVVIVVARTGMRDRGGEAPARPDEFGEERIHAGGMRRFWPG